jgi:shikimate dehydrogenase
MQNAAFAAVGLNAVYVALDVSPARLEEALRGLHACGVAGLNLTTPHKEAAFRFAIEMTEEARAVSAVNTLRWEESGWRGHATDGIGFAAWVADAGIEIRGKRVLVLGAGGAARSIVPRLVSLGASEIAVASRSQEHAAAAAASAARPGSDRGARAYAALGDAAAAREMGTWDVMVRALAAESISPEEDRWWRALAQAAPVLELNYADRAEATRARARAEGRRIEDGLALLWHQGAASFEFWTNVTAPLRAMKAALAGE